MSGAIPEQLMLDDNTVERAVDPLDLMDPRDWDDIPTSVEMVIVIDTEAA